jgi:Pyruvate/2-oxoacid:ferredoxin oxidoreductase delta subunit
MSVNDLESAMILLLARSRPAAEVVDLQTPWGCHDVSDVAKLLGEQRARPDNAVILIEAPAIHLASRLRAMGKDVAVIDHHTCVSWQPDSFLMCKTCYNVCPFRDTAIRMEEFRPHVDERYCTGCGICTNACLVDRKQGGKAINIKPIYATTKLPEVTQ